MASSSAHGRMWHMDCWACQAHHFGLHRCGRIVCGHREDALSLINRVLENVEKRQASMQVSGAGGANTQSAQVTPVLAENALGLKRRLVLRFCIVAGAMFLVWALFQAWHPLRMPAAIVSNPAPLAVSLTLPATSASLASQSRSQRDSRITHHLFSAWQSELPLVNASPKVTAGKQSRQLAMQTEIPTSLPTMSTAILPQATKSAGMDASQAVMASPAADKDAVTKRIKPEQEVNVLMQRAVDAEQKGRGSEALALLRQAVASFPHVEDARLMLVNFLLDAKQEAEALSVLQAGIASYPEQGQVRKALAKWQLAHAQAAEAIATLQPMAATSAQDLEWQWMQAMAHQQTDQHALAVPYFERAIQLKPTQAHAYVAYAVSLQAVGQRAQALQQLRLAQDYPMSERMTAFVLQRTQQLSQTVER